MPANHVNVDTPIPKDAPNQPQMLTVTVRTLQTLPICIYLLRLLNFNRSKVAAIIRGKSRNVNCFKIAIHIYVFLANYFIQHLNQKQSN